MKKLIEFSQRYVLENKDVLMDINERADKAYSSKADSTLGESMMNAITGGLKMNPEEIVESAKVIMKLKRSALIQIGPLMYLCNKYGVASCTVPSGISVKCLSYVEGPCIPYPMKDEIFKKLGITSSACTKYIGERIYDYSHCVTI
ncbi:hypothetical protein A3715_13985 [Oleiphilus sp. HI0009]|nr:hypothetical protein A3715_13985 [Oleiphilus sp. HI0009]